MIALLELLLLALSTADWLLCCLLDSINNIAKYSVFAKFQAMIRLTSQAQPIGYPPLTPPSTHQSRPITAKNDILTAFLIKFSKLKNPKKVKNHAKWARRSRIAPSSHLYQATPAYPPPAAPRRCPWPGRFRARDQIRTGHQTKYAGQFLGAMGQSEAVTHTPKL